LNQKRGISGGREEGKEAVKVMNSIRGVETVGVERISGN
jgi:hypothetical protein